MNHTCDEDRHFCALLVGSPMINPRVSKAFNAGEELLTSYGPEYFEDESCESLYCCKYGIPFQQRRTQEYDPEMAMLFESFVKSLLSLPTPPYPLL